VPASARTVDAKLMLDAIDMGQLKRRGNAKKHLTQQPNVKNQVSLFEGRWVILFETWYKSNLPDKGVKAPEYM
jgi:hypothetical protein